ncbi:hypothetical protein CBL_02873 [Carabus blaptoides fortunei]
MYWNFIDDPVSTYGYYNFFPGALAAIEEDDDLVIIPPNVDTLTDTEEMNENEILSVNMPNDVAGTIEIMKNAQPDSDWDTSDDEVLFNIKKRIKKGSLEEFTPHNVNIEALGAFNPVEIFEKFLDDSTIKYIIQQTLLYAVQNNRHDFSVTEEEIRTFIAILFLSGYHQLPHFIGGMMMILV